MFADETGVRESLLRVIRRMTADVTLQDDLLQEALIHWWLMQNHRPGQTRSWYLQSVKFHLLHHLSAGRSIDSAKRRNGQFHPEHPADSNGYDEEEDPAAGVVSSVSVRDLLAQLFRRLVPQERTVLQYLAEGWGAREIGRKLKMSHTMVLKHRRRIASVLMRLETPARPGVRLPKNGDHHAADRTAVNGSRAMPSKRINAVNGQNGHSNGANNHTNGHNGVKGVKRTGAKPSSLRKIANRDALDDQIIDFFPVPPSPSASATVAFPSNA
jgi:DNA-directed RNA polymerase specialized sigma24 family protein